MLLCNVLYILYSYIYCTEEASEMTAKYLQNKLCF